MAKKAAYVVRVGRIPGIYFTYAECQKQVDGFSGAKHQGYSTREAAKTAWDDWHASNSADQGQLSERTASSLGVPDPGGKDEIIDSQKDEDSRSVAIPDEAAFAFKTPDPGDPYNVKRKRYATLDDAEDVQHASKKDKTTADVLGPVQVESQDEPPVTLTAEQQAVVDMALDNQNLFLTGAAGSGKTVTLKEIIKRLGSYGKRVQVIAPTGIAALPLQGMTTYSFAGWQPDSLQKPIQYLLDTTSKATRKRIRKPDVLVIEEISMVENQFLARLNLLMQRICVNTEPMGGKQVVFVGDFHQLPPVKPFEFCLNCGEEYPNNRSNIVCQNAECKDVGQEIFHQEDKYAFKAQVWAELKLRHVMLEQIHRQKDASFQLTLNKIRDGNILSDGEWLALTSKKVLPDGVVAVKLMSRILQVQAHNSKELALIKSKEMRWQAHDSAKKLFFSPEDDYEPRRSEIENGRRMFELSLSQGEHRFPTDLQSGLVNGSQGEVIGFRDTASWQEPKLTNSEKEHLERFKEHNHTLRPIVKFSNGRTQTIRPQTQGGQKRKNKDSYFVARTQIPLTLAWALSIHKSQGMTLEYVEVCSDKRFEAGQLYVGLSRATKLEGLTVTGASREQITMPSEVVQFYESEHWEHLRPSRSSAANSPAQTESVVEEESLQQSPSNEDGSGTSNSNWSNPVAAIRRFQYNPK
ncbi:ATP-dependent DNA helicase [Lachnellula willkommii]|uniref:ATP-dependent DNA helicase n=1 Tax=Lachnellula willkommii TaxID=215461 RepID=A0A559MJM6_9HELO|nr:ATP-dependent DNA helicase [Lachnellula willkommii]